ncbi:HAD-IIB family hydrolase [Nitrosophilus alvini]|uniref:HAD-IIB family hydrolase n=1 Tax=Nitrosophilus alvini TaxID=2714855 RepID=UPI00190D6862|nr:HAD-IIB family hydrolase [Nitrosophilus alvini]
MKKLFVTDLDKTFLRTDLTLSEYSKKVWNEKAKNHLLSIATARSLKTSLQFLDGLSINLPMILLDGAMVATSEKKLIALNALSKEITDSIIAEGKKFDILPFIVGINEGVNELFLYPEKTNIYQKELLAKYKNDSRLTNIKDIKGINKNLKVVYMGEEKHMSELSKRLKEVFANEIEIKLSKDPYIDCHFLTLLHPKGDKSHALEELLEYTKSKKEHLTVFGDSHNDVGMFKKAGKSVAVKNAVEEVKKIAHIVLPHTNDEDAVARYLEKI